MNAIFRDFCILISVIVGIASAFLYIDENNKQAKFEERRNLILKISTKNKEECDSKYSGYARSNCHYHNSVATIELISQERRRLGL